MSHTQSSVELLFFYAGAVLYGHLPVVSFGLAAAALLVLSGLAFGRGRPTLTPYRWHFLSGTLVFGLVAASDVLLRDHFLLAVLQGISLIVMILMLAANVRLERAEKSKRAPRR